MPELIKTLDMRLQSSFFVYNDFTYEHIFGYLMGSPLSSIIANMVMEEINSASKVVQIRVALVPAPSPNKWGGLRQQGHPA